MFSTALIALSTIPLAFAATTFNVTVGGPGGVIGYSPEFVNASIGDTVLFTFQQKNYTVTQSSLADPCSPLAGGFDSGFQPVEATNTAGPFPQAQFIVQDDKPVWVYCRQTGHCQEGMVFAINPGSNETFQEFKNNAIGNSSSTSSSSSASAASQTTASAVSTTVSSATATSSATTSGSSTNHLVIVGGSAGEVYTPSNISAQVGDTITFQFQTKNHTATQSSFAQPCIPLADSSSSGQVGFDTGFMPVSANATEFPTYTITINNTAPLWAFCRQTGHCGAGMVFSANAPSSGNTFATFKNNAIEQNGTASAAKSASSAGATSTSGAMAIRASLTGLAGALAAFALVA